MWIDKNGDKLERLPRKPFVLTCDRPDFIEQMKDSLKADIQYSSEECDERNNYRFDNCSYEFFSIEDMSLFLNSTRELGINVMTVYNRLD